MDNPMREYKVKSGLSVARIARGFKMSMPTVRRIVYRATPNTYLNMSLKTLLRLQKGMGVDLINWAKKRGEEQGIL